MKNEETITIIVPCYNEEENILVFYKTLNHVLQQIELEHEIVFINDGSKDNTIKEIKKLTAIDSTVLFLSLARNFGKESAIYAGLSNAKGDYVAIMDADLQDPPSLLPTMIEKIKSNKCDSVATRRINRKGEPVIRTFFAKLFYRIINRFSDIEVADGARDYRLMKRDMVDAIVAMGEYNRFSKGIFGWVGFRTEWVEFENIERNAGDSKWSFLKLLKYAIEGIVSFSQTPLNIASWLGALMTLISFISIAFIVVRRIMFGDPVAGWASTICIIVFIGGIQLAVLGIIGQYLAKTYLETKNRPHYIVAETNGNNIKTIG